MRTLLRILQVPVLGLVAVALVTAFGSPAAAFEDQQFCLAVREIIRSAASDVGTWADRFTRNDGTELVCEGKLVHFKRYYGAPASGLRNEWMERKATEWESGYCKRPMWREAVENGWIISSTITTAAGDQVWLACLPGGTAFHRVIPKR